MVARGLVSGAGAIWLVFLRGFCGVADCVSDHSQAAHRKRKIGRLHVGEAHGGFLSTP
jgi:hypothetical protein